MFVKRSFDQGLHFIPVFNLNLRYGITFSNYFDALIVGSGCGRLKRVIKPNSSQVKVVPICGLPVPICSGRIAYGAVRRRRRCIGHLERQYKSIKRGTHLACRNSMPVLFVIPCHSIAISIRMFYRGITPRTIPVILKFLIITESISYPILRGYSRAERHRLGVGGRMTRRIHVWRELRVGIEFAA